MRYSLKYQDRDNFIQRLGNIVTDSEAFWLAWALMGKVARDFQDTTYILKMFGKKG